MSIRFARPVESQYIDQYVPMPLDILQGVAERKQQSLDTAKAGLEGLQDLLKVNYIDDPSFGVGFTHKPQAQKLRESYLQKLNPIYNSLYKEGDYAGAAMQMNQIKRDWQYDPTRLELEESYKHYQQFLPEYQKIKADPTKFYEGYWKPYTKWSGDKEGEPNPFRFAGAKSRIDYIPDAQKLISGIAASGKDNGFYSIKKDGSIVGHKSGWEGIFREDLRRVAEANLEAFFSGQSAGFFIDETLDQLRSQGIDPATLDPSELEEIISNRALNLMIGLGEKQLFKKSKSESNISFVPEWYQNKKDALKPPPTQVLPNTGDTTGFIIGDLKRETNPVTDPNALLRLKALEAKLAFGKYMLTQDEIDFLKNNNYELIPGKPIYSENIQYERGQFGKLIHAGSKSVNVGTTPSTWIQKGNYVQDDLYNFANSIYETSKSVYTPDQLQKMGINNVEDAFNKFKEGWNNYNYIHGIAEPFDANTQKWLGQIYGQDASLADVLFNVEKVRVISSNKSGVPTGATLSSEELLSNINQKKVKNLEATKRLIYGPNMPSGGYVWTVTTKDDKNNTDKTVSFVVPPATVQEQQAFADLGNVFNAAFSPNQTRGFITASGHRLVQSTLNPSIGYVVSPYLASNGRPQAKVDYYIIDPSSKELKAYKGSNNTIEEFVKIQQEQARQSLQEFNFSSMQKEGKQFDIPGAQ